MYKLEVESEMFRGLSLVKQHKLVTETLRGDIAQMHGITIKTRVRDE